MRMRLRVRIQIHHLRPTYLHTYVLYICAHARMDMHTCMHTFMHTYTQAFTYVHVYTYIHSHTHTRTHTHTHTGTRTRTRTCTLIHSHTYVVHLYFVLSHTHEINSSFSSSVPAVATPVHAMVAATFRKGRHLPREKLEGFSLIKAPLKGKPIMEPYSNYSTLKGSLRSLFHTQKVPRKIQ